jgi:DNA-binding MarR family transcriptional regulator
MVSKGDRVLNRSAIHLIHRVGQCATDIFQDEARRSGLTPRQFALLMTIADEEGLTQTDLVERTGIDRSTLADMVARLLARGLIQRRRAKEDGRAYAIKLSTQGWKVLRDAEPGAVAAELRLLDPLPPGRREEFLNALDTIVAAVRKPG